MKEYINITCEDNMALMARYPDGHFDLLLLILRMGLGRD
jgi:hypothetical protein